MVRVSGVREFLDRSGALGRWVLLSALTALAVSAQAQQPESIRKTSSVTSPERLSASFAEIAKRVEPAVVSIDTKGKIPEVTIRGDQEGKSRDLEDFIRRNLPPRPAYAVGSGFIVDPRGYLLTNYHVVKDAERIKVKLQDGEEFVAKLLGADEETSDISMVSSDPERDRIGPPVHLSGPQTASAGAPGAPKARTGDQSGSSGNGSGAVCQRTD